MALEEHHARVIRQGRHAVEGIWNDLWRATATYNAAARYDGDVGARYRAVGCDRQAARAALHRLWDTFDRDPVRQRLLRGSAATA